MKKRIVALLIFVVLMLLLAGCAKAGDVVWEEEFSSTENWKVDFDGHVFCQDIDVSNQDIRFASVQIDTPSEDGIAGVLVANVDDRPGLFLNGIAHRPFEFQDKSTYVLSGYFAAIPGTEIEVMDAAIEFVHNGIGHYADLNHRLNHYVTQEIDVAAYGWVFTREGVNYTPFLLYNAGDDRDWHYFELQISVDVSSDLYTIDRVHFDGREFVVNVEMPSEAKEPGYADIAQVFLETHNMNTNCEPQYNFKGASAWDSITLTRYPLGEAPEEPQKTVSN